MSALWKRDRAERLAIMSGYRSLGAAVLLQAVKDLRSDCDEKALDSLFWLILSPQASFLAECLDIESDPGELLFTERRISHIRKKTDY